MGRHDNQCHTERLLMVMVQKVQGALKRKKNAGGTINNVKPHDVIQVGKSIFVALKRCLSEPEMARLLDTIDDTSLAASDLSEVLSEFSNLDYSTQTRHGKNKSYS